MTARLVVVDGALVENSELGIIAQTGRPAPGLGVEPGLLDLAVALTVRVAAEGIEGNFQREGRHSGRMHGGVLASTLQQVQEHSAFFGSVGNDGGAGREFQRIEGKRRDFGRRLREGGSDQQQDEQRDARGPDGHGAHSSGRIKMLDQD